MSSFFLGVAVAPAGCGSPEKERFREYLPRLERHEALCMASFVDR